MARIRKSKEKIITNMILKSIQRSRHVDMSATKKGMTGAALPEPMAKQEGVIHFGFVRLGTSCKSPTSWYTEGLFILDFLG